MTDGYQDLEFITDPRELADGAFDVMRARQPGWEPEPASIATWMIEAVAEGIAAPIADSANQVPDTIFHSWLEEILGLPPLTGTPAQLTTTWTFRDPAGYTVPAGTQISVNNPAGDPIMFQTVADIVCPAGQDTVAATIYAVEPGADANGIIPGVGDVQLAEQVTFVSMVAGEGITSGGSDPETEQEYVDRGARRLRTLGGGLVLPEDYATRALDTAGVARAMGINGLIPPASTGQERAVAVVVHGPGGVPCSTAVKDAVAADLQARREVNFIVSVIDPTFTTIDVTATATANKGYATGEVQAAAVAALQEYLSPAVWGSVFEGEAAGVWENQTKVRYFEIVHVLEGVIGVDHLDALQVNGGTTDITMTGHGPLPQPGSMTITINPAP